LDYGEAWMWCSDCGGKLYSFDGNEDKNIKCPTKKECQEENSKKIY
jgi:hypothetical protein